jgi:hypothetical protein
MKRDVDSMPIDEHMAWPRGSHPGLYRGSGGVVSAWPYQVRPALFFAKPGRGADFAVLRTAAFAVGDALLAMHGRGWAPRLPGFNRLAVPVRSPVGATAQDLVTTSIAEGVRGAQSASVRRTVVDDVPRRSRAAIASIDVAQWPRIDGAKAELSPFHLAPIVGTTVMGTANSFALSGVRAPVRSFARALVDTVGRAATMMRPDQPHGAAWATRAPAPGGTIGTNRLEFGLAADVDLAPLRDVGQPAAGVRGKLPTRDDRRRSEDGAVEAMAGAADEPAPDRLDDMLDDYFARHARLPPASGGAFDPLMTPLWYGQKLNV